MERWRGRVAVVTGCSSGIGEAIARELAERGMRVLAVARRLDRLQSVAAEVRGAGHELHVAQCDVTREEDVLRVVSQARQQLGGVDVLVNNAGVYHKFPLAESDTAKMRQMLDTNVLGLSMFTREVVKDMRDRGVDDGHIFHISSISGQRLVDVPNAYFYSASKHAVKVLTEGLRRELRDLGTKIRVTGLSPGLVRTEIMAASGLSPEENQRYFESSGPCLEPRDIVEALIYALGTPPHVQVHEITILPLGTPR